MTAPDPAARAALLRRLPRDGFVPPDDAAPWSAAARAAAFAAEVEAFAAAYWALAPDARRARFNALWEGRYGPAAARLAELESGLGVEDPTPRSSEETALTGIARELYVLRPRERARRRTAWLAGLGLERAGWEAAARAMAFADPVGARFDPQLFARLAVHLLPLPRGVAARAGPVRNPRAEEERDARNAQLIYRYGCWVLGLLVVLGCVLVPQFRRVPDDPPARRPVFSVQQVDEFLEFEQSRREGAPDRPPPRYHDWRGAGRPRGETPH